MLANSHTARLIKLYRVARGWRQLDLANALGVSRVRISQVERGGYVSPAVLLRFADALKSDDLRKIAIERGAQ